MPLKSRLFLNSVVFEKCKDDNGQLQTHCTNCSAMPYHEGKTCEEFRREATWPTCRFCQEKFEPKQNNGRNGRRRRTVPHERNVCEECKPFLKVTCNIERDCFGKDGQPHQCYGISIAHAHSLCPPCNTIFSVPFFVQVKKVYRSETYPRFFYS